MASRQASVARAVASGSADVIIYSRAGCSYCSRAKALLSARGVNFAVVDLGVETERRQEAVDLSGASTVPQIFVGSRCLGGYSDLKCLDDAGTLSSALTRAAEDGPAIAPTPDTLLSSASLIPERARTLLSPRAAAMRALRYEAGSQPTLRAFFRYALTSMPSQDQSKNVPLNLAAAPGDATPPPALADANATDLATLLRQAMLQLLDSFVDPATGDVDYATMRDSDDWQLFRALAAELGDPRLQGDLLNMPEAERKAFFINLYNAMIFHGVVVFGRRPGMWNLYCFFIAPAVSYRLAGVPVSLDDIEHGLLRAKAGYFEAADQELQSRVRMPQVDPRIHMALNCGARGCPVVATYDGETLDATLDEAVAVFVADDLNVSLSSSGDGARVRVTELFKMYLEDFVGQGAKPGNKPSQVALLEWIVRYARGDKRERLDAALAPGAKPLVVEFLAYDWATNGVDVPLESRIYTPKL